MKKDYKDNYDSPVPSIDEKLREWEAERDLPPNGRTAVYVSTPITTGPNFVEWMKTEGQYLKKGSEEYEISLKANVILPNIQQAATALELLRWRHMGLIINPIGLEVPGWTQSDYHQFWKMVITRHIRRVILFQGWQYSRGCTIEFETAQRHGIDCVDSNLKFISREKGLKLIESAVKQIKSVGVDSSALEEIGRTIDQQQNLKVSHKRQLFKDEVLDHLARTANVAQFVSFAPGSELKQRFCRIIGYEPNDKFASPEDAIRALLELAPESKVNIRSYNPYLPEGNPFIKNLETVNDVIETLRYLAGKKKLFTIVNEVINESDGGVSGVCHRGLIEFAPDSNPRCVDNDEMETAVLPFEIGMKILSSVYGIEPDLRGREGARIEFSVHPNRRGWNHDHTIIWQSEQNPKKDSETTCQWPHPFSQMLGDKAFGLLVADATGFHVPKSVVFSQRLFPFTFGQPTGTNKKWTRPCPEKKERGFYPTSRGWHNPYEVLAGRILKPHKRTSDTPAAPLASVIIQEGVAAKYSGRCRYSSSEKIDIQGVKGEGDDFMIGALYDEKLPGKVANIVKQTCEQITRKLGAADFEWVFDGTRVWIVQLDSVKDQIAQTIPNKNIEWIDFKYTKDRLEDYRKMVIALRGKNVGIKIIGRVSPLSHVGQIAEDNGVPTVFHRR